MKRGSMIRFKDRDDAGRLLAGELTAYARRPDVLVLALPRGGVPVGFQVASALHAPLDILVVRKLGVPGYEELAMGAIASGGVRVLNDEVVRKLRISGEIIDAAAALEERELERRELAYRGSRPRPEIRGRTVILVDDGIATGSTMRAAVRALRKQQPARIVVAAPVVPPPTADQLGPEVDELVCILMPPAMLSIGSWYEEFPQTSDDEVRRLLEQAAAAPKGGAVQA